MYKIKNILIVFGLFLISCTKENPVESNTTNVVIQDSTTRANSGSLFGFARPALPGSNYDCSGVKVSLEGTSFSAVTDTKGAWQIINLPFNTYIIVFAKAGFATTKIPNFKFAKDSTSVSSLYLYQIPPWNFTNLNVEKVFSGIELRGTLIGSLTTEDKYSMLVFLSSTPDVSSDPNKYLFTCEIRAAAYATPPPDSIFIDTTELAQHGFVSGQSVYAVAYVNSVAATPYVDVATGRYVYPCLSPTPSPVVSFTVPY